MPSNFMAEIVGRKILQQKPLNEAERAWVAMFINVSTLARVATATGNEKEAARYQKRVDALLTQEVA